MYISDFWEWRLHGRCFQYKRKKCVQRIVSYMWKMTGIFQKNLDQMSNGNVVTKRMSLTRCACPITRHKIAMISTNHNSAVWFRSAATPTVGPVARPEVCSPEVARSNPCGGDIAQLSSLNKKKKKRSHLSCSAMVSLPMKTKSWSARNILIKCPLTAITNPRSEPAATWDMCWRHECLN